MLLLPTRSCKHVEEKAPTDRLGGAMKDSMIRSLLLKRLAMDVDAKVEVAAPRA